MHGAVWAGCVGLFIHSFIHATSKCPLSAHVCWAEAVAPTMWLECTGGDVGVELRSEHRRGPLREGLRRLCEVFGVRVTLRRLAGTFSFSVLRPGRKLGRKISFLEREGRK